jgi:hypothetical protein
MPRCITTKTDRFGSVEVLCLRHRVERFQIRGVAALIWKRLNGKTAMKRVVAEVVDKFSVTEKKAEKDIQKFIKELLYLELIREDVSAAPLRAKSTKPYSSATKSSQPRQKSSISGKVSKKLVPRR